MKKGIKFKREAKAIFAGLTAEQASALIDALCCAMDGQPVPPLDEATKAAFDKMLKWQKWGVEKNA